MAVHNRQCLSKLVCRTHTFLDSPPPQKMYTSTFFKWKICHENDIKLVKMTFYSTYIISNAYFFVETFAAAIGSAFST